MTVYKQLCTELVEKLDELNCRYNVPNQSALIERALAALAEPEPDPEEVKKWLITNCVLSGMPPAPYRTWNEWAEAVVSAKVIQGVHIKALEDPR